MGCYVEVSKKIERKEMEKQNLGGDPPGWKADYSLLSDILWDVRWK